jgi:signal transduction histidine kinase/CHASE3 domain sensor protein
LARKVTVACVVLAAVGAAGFAVVLLEVVHLRHATRVERNATSAQAAGDDVMRDVLDLETGVRGFVITGRPEFLQPWRRAMRRLPGDARDVERLVAADAKEEAAANAFANVALAYRDEWARRVVTLARRDPQAARSVVAGDAARRRVDAIRSRFSALETAEEALARRRAGAGDAAVVSAIAAGIAGFAGSVLLVALFALYLWYRVLRPVGRVADAAAVVGGGNLEVRVPEDATGEIRVLAQAFNRMAVSLAEQRDDAVRRAEELERAGMVSRAVLDSTVDGICLTDLQGTILLANAPLARYVEDLGIPTRGTIYERLMAISDRFAEPDDYREAMRRIASNPAARTTDEFRFLDNGRSFRGFTAPVRDSSGDFVGRIFTLREVTAEREAERLKDEFVATVSHELRTPLTSILGYLELVLNDEALPQEQRSHLDVVSRNACRLLRVVGDLLFVAQVESGALHLQPELVEPAHVAAQALEAAKPVAAEAGVELVLDVEPTGAAELDPARIAQLLDNLISNALKFTPAGGRVTVRLRAEGDELVLAVVDTGVGIPAEEQELLFNRFFRSERSQRLAVPGTGLGLAIVRAIAVGHGGRVAIWSEEGKGAVLTVTMPLRRPSEQPSEYSSAAAAT